MAQSAHNQQFRVPKVFAYVSIRNPMASKNTRSELLARLFSDVVEENLKDISYPAGEAGLNLYFGHTDTGLEIQMDGWSEKYVF